jgi:hypothetical protein
MVNAGESEEVTGEAEALVVITPEQFFGDAKIWEDRNWAARGVAHIVGNVDYAGDYETEHVGDDPRHIGTMRRNTDANGVTLGRNPDQIAALGRFERGEQKIDSAAFFNAFGKPTAPKQRPVWLYVRGEKDNLGRNDTAKTPKPKNIDDLQRLMLAGNGFINDVLAGGDSVGVLRRVIVKYMLKIGILENGEDAIVAPDFRVDEMVRMQRVGGVLQISDPHYLTSVEVELEKDGDPGKLEAGMEKIYGFLAGEREGFRTSDLRFGTLALAEDPRGYVRSELASANPSLNSGTAFDDYYESMQRAAARIFEAYRGDPVSMIKVLDMGRYDLLGPLQNVDRF